MAAMNSGAAGLRARWEQLSERERRLVSAMIAVAVVLLLAVSALVVHGSLGDLADDNEAMRRVLKEIDEGRDNYQRLRMKSQQVEARIGHGGVQLEGLLETAANQSNVEISESTERAAVAVANKKYTERAVDVRLRKVTIDKLAHFLRKLETGPNLVVVTRLSARVRDDKHEELEVEMTVTTWEKADGKKAGGPSGPGGSGAGGGDGKEGKG